MAESLRSEHTREDYAFDIQRLAYRQQPQVARIVG